MSLDTPSGGQGNHHNRIAKYLKKKEAAPDFDEGIDLDDLPLRIDPASAAENHDTIDAEERTRENTRRTMERMLVWFQHAMVAAAFTGVGIGGYLIGQEAEYVRSRKSVQLKEAENSSLKRENRVLQDHARSVEHLNEGWRDLFKMKLRELDAYKTKEADSSGQ